VSQAAHKSLPKGAAAAAGSAFIHNTRQVSVRALFAHDSHSSVGGEEINIIKEY